MLDAVAPRPTIEPNDGARVLRWGPAQLGWTTATRGGKPDLYDRKINRSYAELAAH